MVNTSFVLQDLREDGILLLTINRPTQYNALNIATLTGLEQILVEARQQPQVRALLLTGAGEKAFVAGADISEFQQVQPVDSRDFAERGQRILQLLEDMPVPTVAAINGFALGGGCELALACHIRIASEHAQIGLPEVKLGIIPGYGGTQRLTQLVGKGKALELMLTGNPISSRDALQIGLINHVVPATELLSASVQLLQQILERAPQALRGVLAAVAAAQQGGPQGYKAESAAFEACCHTQDFREGVQAFLEKRPARFYNR